MGKESEVLKDETKKDIVNESLQKNLNRHGENKEPEMEGPEVISTVFCISNEETGFAKSGVAKDSEEDHERLKVINQDPDPVLIKETVTRGNYGGGPQNRTKDGGFCWMVVIASFLSNFLFAGTRSCMGIIQAELEKTLEDGSAGLEWTGALVNAVPLLLGMLTICFFSQFYSGFVAYNCKYSFQEYFILLWKRHQYSYTHSKRSLNHQLYSSLPKDLVLKMG